MLGEIFTRNEIGVVLVLMHTLSGLSLFQAIYYTHM